MELIGIPSIAIVAGATGLVGRELVRQLGADQTWGEVRPLVRRQLPPELAGATVAPVQVDYDRLDPPPPWAAADHVFCALGTTIRQAGSRAAFREVDLKYPVALARAALLLGARHFLLVSAVGAAPGSRVFYNRVKGEVEAAIAALGFRSVTIARPSLLLGSRPEPRVGEQVGKILGLLAPPRWRPVAGARVARALVDAAKADLAGLRVIENRDLRAARG
ncbi:MAG TPA: NAD(P)H-binding protein [Gemmatimonadales bacterium]|nr:NAD(P)H-binding protein [Gemmatimonadales bacterium]